MTHYDYALMEMMITGGFSYGGISTIFSIVGFVFSAIALRSIARRRGISHSWLAWVPVANLWVLGSIADQYRDIAKGEIKNRRKTLVILSVVRALATVAAVACVIVGIVTAFAVEQKGAGGYIPALNVTHGLLKAVPWALGAFLVNLATRVFEYIALYDLYSSCDPANNVLYLILTVIPAINKITRPLFLFLVRDRDDGMPHRRGRRV